MSQFEFTWGDTVQVNRDAPSVLRPNLTCEVCGMREATMDEELHELRVVKGTSIYTVEFGDGMSMEIPSEYLMKISFEQPLE